MVDACVMESLVIRHEQSMSVKSLQEFHSGHRLPTEINDRTKTFVGKCGHQEISDELDSKFSDFRKHMKMKRVDLKVGDPDGGMGMINTPWFDYQVHMTQSDEDPSEAILIRQLVSIQDTDILSNDGFVAIFGNQFNCVEYVPPEPIDIEAFIDHVEDQEFPEVQIDYDRTASWCSLTAPGIPGEVSLEGSTIRLNMAQLQPPLDLLNAFIALQSQLGFAMPDQEPTVSDD